MKVFRQGGCFFGILAKHSAPLSVTGSADNQAIGFELGWEAFRMSANGVPPRLLAE
jgi:hypothetical protein